MCPTLETSAEIVPFNTLSQGKSKDLWDQPNYAATSIPELRSLGSRWLSEISAPRARPYLGVQFERPLILEPRFPRNSGGFVSLPEVVVDSGGVRLDLGGAFQGSDSCVVPALLRVGGAKVHECLVTLRTAPGDVLKDIRGTAKSPSLNIVIPWFSSDNSSGMVSLAFLFPTFLFDHE